MPKIKINIFGEGIEIKRLVLPDTLLSDWKERAVRKNISLCDMILDPFFYHNLKDAAFSSIEDLPSDKISGMLDNPKNQLEIWLDRKKVLKWYAADLFNEMLLFPLFQVQKEALEQQWKSGIVVTQKERGQLATLELNIEEDRLNLDDMLFHIKNGLGHSFLSDISHKNTPFRFVKKETLIVHQSATEFF